MALFWGCSEFKKRQKAAQVAKQREEKKVLSQFAHRSPALCFSGGGGLVLLPGYVILYTV